MNYVWTPTFPMDDHKESIALYPMGQVARTDTVKRDYDEYSPKQMSNSHKKQRKTKTKTESSSSEDLNSDAPKDKGRGRYACLNHRLKHKRCPPDCKERRPKPMNPSDLSPGSPNNTTAPTMDSPQRNILQLDERERAISKAPAHQYVNHHQPQSAPVGINPMQTVSALPSLSEGCPVEWDSVEWDNLMDDHTVGSQNQWGPGWDDMHQQHNPPPATQWEPEIAEEHKAVSVPSGNSETHVNGSSAEGISMKSLLKNVLLTRDSIERWIAEPYFNRLLQGFFVRVRIGEYMDTSVYRIARVEEVVDRAFFAYNLGNQQTTKGVVLQIGSTRKTFSLLSVSNKEPSENDFNHWEEEMIKAKFSLSEPEVLQKEEVVRVMNLKYPAKMPNPSFASTSN